MARRERKLGLWLASSSTAALLIGGGTPAALAACANNINAAFDTESIVRRMQPLQRLGTTRDVANAAVYLASERAAQVTGTVLPVDGGTTAGPPPSSVGEGSRPRQG